MSVNKTTPKRVEELDRQDDNVDLLKEQTPSLSYLQKTYFICLWHSSLNISINCHTWDLSLSGPKLKTKIVTINPVQRIGDTRN